MVYLRKSPFEKQKSAPTEVNAPKNANPDCRETKPKCIKEYPEHTYSGICVFTKFKYMCVDKRG